MSNRPPPHLRTWKFTNEAFSPWELYLIQCHQGWLKLLDEAHRTNDFFADTRKYRSMLSKIEREAKSFGLTLSRRRLDGSEHE